MPPNLSSVMLPPTTQQITADARSLDRLKQAAIQNPEQTVRQAARQFEAQFAQMLLTEMNKTSFLNQDDPLTQIFGQGKSDTWGSMLTQERAQQMAGLNSDGSLQKEYHGLGLAPVIERQLTQQLQSKVKAGLQGVPSNMSTLELARASRAKVEQFQQKHAVSSMNTATGAAPTMGLGQEAFPAYRATGPNALWIQQLQQQTNIKRIQNGQFSAPRAQMPRKSTVPLANHIPLETGDSKLSQVRDAFVQKFLPAAQRAEEKTGIPAHFILGQAALESGWGKHEIRSANGKQTYNLFGIKATGWKGDVSKNLTTEYVNGKAIRVREGFRSYNSYEHAFEDYARLLAQNPRYSKVVQSRTPHEFAYGLQKAGYATDPKYGAKVLRMIDHMLGKTQLT